MTKNIDQTIVDFVNWSVQEADVDPLDRVYIKNRLLTLLGKIEISPLSPSAEPVDALQLLDDMIDYAVQEEVIEDLSSAKDSLGAKIMDLITPSPSEINRLFWSAYEDSYEKATQFFFRKSQLNNYIKTREIAKNIEYTHATEYGDLEITINLSKPEKDPKEIALGANSSSSYPECMLCLENEGYEGHITHPGRANHRIIRMNVNGEEWGLQYSPYAYYNEHSIFLSKVHRKMNVGIRAIENLLDILTTFPHYFVGSNAGLPIVGGSILSHDHYQGGRYTFPLEQSEIEKEIELAETPSVQAGIVKWPMSVIRLRSENKEELIQAADKVMTQWEKYSNASVGIHSHTDGTPHNAITPIARRKGEAFELDMVLRNNRTSEDYPDGIFHPHPPVQHIKKENIGLIEVMGLAILPPRLKTELETVRQYLIGEADSVDAIHQRWADELKQNNTITADNVKDVVEEAVGEVFLQVLKDAGVFKRDEEGMQAFLDFAQTLN
ncbi:UDP-glucose--hexose-1-phosphate uridylyltransferase [Alkalibacterium iburiense]|uniref:Galactose-1-phosphate uridylyltransferase n=1 Tax=Alkalibacterium iburiense TaxID=290589 RepID=A0ABN0X6G1_9LACT